MNSRYCRRPRDQAGTGGISSTTSAATKAARARVSARSMARAYLSTRSGSSAETVMALPTPGFSAARARWSAEFTAGMLVLSTAAVSAAVQPNTSRSTNAPRWRAGSAWSIAVTASRTSAAREVGDGLDLSDVRGQHHAVRALIIAAQLNFAMTPDLTRYVLRNSAAAGVEGLIEAQQSHYGMIRANAAELDGWLLSIQRQVDDRVESICLPDKK